MSRKAGFTTITAAFASVVVTAALLIASAPLAVAKPKPCTPSKVSGALTWDKSDPTILVLRPSASVRNCRGRVARLDVTVTIFNPSTGGIKSERTWSAALIPGEKSGRVTKKWETYVEYYYSPYGIGNDGLYRFPPGGFDDMRLITCSLNRNGTSIDPAVAGLFYARALAYDKDGKLLSRSQMKEPVRCGVNATTAK